MPRQNRERHAHKLPLHGIGRRELGVEGHVALIACGLQQIGEAPRIGYGLIGAAIEGQRGELGRALLGELHR